MMPIVAYDLTAVPGHEYQYRLRYEAWNQFAGRDGELKDPSSASLATIFSDFSPITPPVLKATLARGDKVKARREE